MEAKKMENHVIRGGWITLNRACNFRCSWCYQQDTAFDPKRTMSPELALEIADLFIQSGAKNVVIIGGEPTVYPALSKIITKLVSGGIRPVVVTNGRELAKKEYVQTLFKAGLKDINISLKAPNEDGYRIMTGTKGSFERVLIGIDNVINQGINLGVSVVIENYFIDHISQYINTINSLSVSHISFDMGSPILTEGGINGNGIPDPFTLAATVEIVHEKMKNTDKSYGFYMTIPLCLLDSQTRDELISQQKITTSCHVSKGTSIIFSEDGSVVPCNHFTNHSVGKFKEDFETAQELNNFWGKEDLREFRNVFNSYPHEQCSRCPHWNICGGGCKIKWMHFDPKDYIGMSVPSHIKRRFKK